MKKCITISKFSLSLPASRPLPATPPLLARSCRHALCLCCLVYQCELLLLMLLLLRFQTTASTQLTALRNAVFRRPLLAHHSASPRLVASPSHAPECLSLLFHRRPVALLLASTWVGGGSIRDTRSSPGFKRTLLFRWLALTLPSSPSSRRMPCTAGRREAACSAGRSCSAVALRRKLTRSSGTCTASTSV